MKQMETRYKPFFIDCVGKECYGIAYADKNLHVMSSKYLKYLWSCHRSINTIRRMAYVLSYYLNYLDENGLTEDTVSQQSFLDQQYHFSNFLQWVKIGLHKSGSIPTSSATVNSYLKGIFRYYSFLEMTGIIDGYIRVWVQEEITINGSHGIKRSRTINRFNGFLREEKNEVRLTNRDIVKKYIEAANLLRDKLILSIIYDTGCRIGEVLGIRYGEDINLDERTIMIKYRRDNENSEFAKYAEEGKVCFSHETKELLLLYISENAELLSRSEYLFVVSEGPTRGKALTKGAFYSVLEKLNTKTGNKLTPHMIRHLFADERYRDSRDILLVSKLLRHRRIATTKQYITITDNELIQASKEYFERNEPIFGGVSDLLVD